MSLRKIALKVPASLSNLAGNGIAALQQLLISIFISKLFGIETFGEFTVHVSVAYLLSFLYNFGFSVTSLVYLQKRYYNIMRVLITFSYVGIFLLALLSLVIPNGIVLLLAVVYAFSITIKEIFNVALVTEKKYGTKLAYNVIELILCVMVFATMFFMRDTKLAIGKDMQLPTVLLALIAARVISSLSLVNSGRVLMIVAPLLQFSSSKGLKIFKRNFFNTLNTFFANLYTQGYYPVIGWFTSVHTVSLVKYISLFQSIIALVITSYLQTRSASLIKAWKLRSKVSNVRDKAFIIQGIGMVIVSLLIIQTNVLKILFGLDSINGLFVLAVTFAYTMVPFKQYYALWLTIRGLYRYRTTAIISSVLVSLPLLYLIRYSPYYVALFILLIDLISVTLFLKKLNNESPHHSWLV